MSAGVTPARLIRLCLKELRESLRDRRTIVTLVLMPLLVYPLLSLVLNRVLLTNITSLSGPSVTIAISAELKNSQLPDILQLGYGLLHERNSAPLFMDVIVQDGQPASNAERADDSALPTPQILVLSDNGREALRSSSVDVVVTRKSTNADYSDDVASAPSSIARALEQFQATGNMPAGFDLEGFLTVAGRYEVRFRQGDQQSERAVQLLERMFAAVNNVTSSRLIGLDYSAPFLLQATPIVMKSDYSELLATMIPLVLVLMTMAGAVYPAIDLTAGERERGTMEALIVSPTPASILLLAKYSAVVTVALLTALANLAAMTITLWVSGIGKLLFGEGVLSTGVIGTVLALLVLFTMFFAALLLAVTSFAKSFKEAQAYLIPLMLLALTPGVLSLLPGIKFSGLLATVPLVNIVLLARQILVGGAEWNTALVAIICNTIYALAALVLASKLFGSDASMHGSQGSWRDLLRRPAEWVATPSVDQMALTMAVMFPFYFVASSTLPAVSQDLSTRLWVSSAVSFVLIFLLPAGICAYRKIDFVSTFRLAFGRTRSWLLIMPAIVLTASSAWMVAHEIIVAGQALGIGTIRTDQMEQVLAFKDELQTLPLWMILFVFAATPAFCEEMLFRGFVLSSLRRYSAFWAILLSSVLFGLMHVLTSQVLAVERFLPSTFMGLILAWVAYRTRSIWPGVLLHALHNGLLLCLTYYQTRLQEWNFLVEEGTHLPTTWLAAGCTALLSGLLLFWWSGRRRSSSLPAAGSLMVEVS